MARAQQSEKVGFRTRLKQIGMVFAFTARRDKWFVPILIAAAAIPIAFTVVAVVLGWGFLWIPVGVMLTLLAVLIVLNLRSNKAMLAQAAEQRGSSAQIVENMRGDWRVTPGLASTTQLDIVHLVIGKPGVILLGEGDKGRVKALIGQERKRLSRVIGSADLRDFHVGQGEGELPIAKLRVTLMKLPRTLTGRDVNALDKRLKALTSRPQLPKGAIPKNMRPPKGAFKMTRGGPR